MLSSFTTASVQASVKLTTIANDTSFAAGIYVASCPTQRAELGIFADIRSQLLCHLRSHD